MSEEELLVPNDVYLKAGIHIGTKFKTKYMDQFIYKTRPDGLSVLNVQKINERIKVMASFLAQYEPEDILIVSRRENGWLPVKMFGKPTWTVGAIVRHVEARLEEAAREARILALNRT